jgi:hypothetical protein
MATALQKLVLCQDLVELPSRHNRYNKGINTQEGITVIGRHRPALGIPNVWHY